MAAVRSELSLLHPFSLLRCPAGRWGPRKRAKSASPTSGASGTFWLDWSSSNGAEHGAVVCALPWHRPVSSHVSHTHTSLASVATVAEAEGHHPDLHLVSYNQVTAQLTTHAAGGLTENDFIMAVRRFCEGGAARKGGLCCCYSGEVALGNKKIDSHHFHLHDNVVVAQVCAKTHTDESASHAGQDRQGGPERRAFQEKGQDRCVEGRDHGRMIGIVWHRSRSQEKNCAGNGHFWNFGTSSRPEADRGKEREVRGDQGSGSAGIP